MLDFTCKRPKFGSVEFYPKIKVMSIETRKQSEKTGKLIILAIIGFLLGISFKNIALEKITMGYEDYKLESLKSDYELP